MAEVKSIRMNDEVYNRLVELAKAQGLQQGAAVEALLNTWDVQAAKGQVPERAADVADFDAAIQAAQKAFLRSLDLAQSAENRARAAYQAQLDAMSATITRLQSELESERRAHTRAIDGQRKAEERAERAEARVEELEKGRKLEALLESLADKLDAPTLPEAKPKRGRKAKTAEGGQETPAAPAAAPANETDAG